MAGSISWELFRGFCSEMSWQRSGSDRLPSTCAFLGASVLGWVDKGVDLIDSPAGLCGPCSLVLGHSYYAKNSRISMSTVDAHRSTSWCSNMSAFCRLPKRYSQLLWYLAFSVLIIVCSIDLVELELTTLMNPDIFKSLWKYCFDCRMMWFPLNTPLKLHLDLYRQLSCMFSKGWAYHWVYSSFSALRIGLFVVYTLKPSSVNERQICVDGALDPSVPGEKTFPWHQPEGSLRATCSGAILQKEELRQRREKRPPSGLLFLSSGLWGHYFMHRFTYQIKLYGMFQGF